MPNPDKKPYGLLPEYLISDAEHVLQGQGMLVVNGRIEAIAERAEISRICKAQGYPLQQAEHMIVFPGFVNAHTHMYGAYSHGIPNPTENFQDFLSDYWWPTMENRIRTEHAVCAARLAAVESLQSGVTCLCDTLEAPLAGGAVLEQEYDVLHAAGLKGVLSTECCERISLENGMAVHGQNMAFALQHRGDRIRGMACSHTTFTCSEAFLRKMYEDSRANGVPWQFHLSESDFEPAYIRDKHQTTPVEYLDGLGVLDSFVLASQCVSVTEREMDILAKRGVGVVHMPLSNCEVGGGVAPVPQMLRRGIPVALGSDGYVNDFFAIMRAAFLFHKGVQKDARLIPASAVFKMATENGAKVMGMGQETGRLQVGMAADYVVLEDRFPTPVLPSNIFDQIILFGSSCMIRQVVIDGSTVMQNGTMPELDAQQVRKAFAQSAAAFWHAGGTKE